MPVHKVLSLHVLFEQAFVCKYDINTCGVAFQICFLSFFLHKQNQQLAARNFLRKMFQDASWSHRVSLIFGYAIIAPPVTNSWSHRIKKMNHQKPMVGNYFTYTPVI